MDGHKIYDSNFPALSTNPSAQYRFSDPSYRSTGAGICALSGVGKQPGLAAKRKGADGVFSPGITDLQVPSFAVTDQVLPLIQCVVHGLAGERAFQHLADVGLQPGFEGLQQGQALFLTHPVTLRITQIPGGLFQRIQFADVAQRHIGFRGLTFFAFGRGGFGGLHELSSCMIPTSNSGQVVVTAHLAIARIAIGLQDAVKVIEQAHRPGSPTSICRIERFCHPP